MEKQFYTLGEVANLCNVPIRTLQYYDELGLLKPAHYDDINEIYYYAKNQLMIANIIIQFKVQDFSIKEMKEQQMNHAVLFTNEAIQKKQNELQNSIQELLQFEKRLYHYLNVMQLNDGTAHLLLKKLPVMKIAYIREPITAEVLAPRERITKLQTLLKRHNLAACNTVMCLYHDQCPDMLTKADFEVCVPIEGTAEIAGCTRTIGGFNVLSAIHYGAYEKEAETYALMLQWMLEHGYVMNGTAIENYLIDCMFTNNQEEFVTELMIPIKTVKS